MMQNYQTGRNPLALVADDDHGMRLLIREALELSGFAVIEAEDGNQALELFDCHRPDIVMLDVMMPEMGGVAACAALRGRPAGMHVPILMVTGLDDLEAIKEAYVAGATDFIAKPIKWPMLGYHVRYMLRAAGAIGKLQQSLEIIQHNANFDRLTDLPNRNLFYERLIRAVSLAESDAPSGAVLVLGLDRFKEINNTLGRQVGDAVLQAIGPRLQSLLGASGTIARLGGDEFALLLPTGANQAAAIEIARNAIKLLERPFFVEGTQLDVSASVGIVVFPQQGVDADTLVKHADAAMDFAKETRCGYSVYSPERDQTNAERLRLMGYLRQAVNDDQFFLLFQPKITLPSGRLIGVEALVRWNHPTLGIVPPDRFIPLAEQSGLIARLTELVLDKALRQCREWRRCGLDINVAVNLSRRDIQSETLPALVRTMLDLHGIPSTRLSLEITETTAMADPTRAMDVLLSLKKLGLRLSLDDFGTGYSSLAYLKKLPVDEIKIDKSFIMKMHQKQENIAIVQMIIDLAHMLGLEVVAEGLETQEAKEQLVSLNCDMAQGYFFSRPVAAEDIMRFVDANNECLGMTQETAQLNGSVTGEPNH